MLYPSMMNVNFGKLAEEVRALDEAGVDGFHCDVMDGCFVPNMAMGLMDIKAIRKSTKKPVDAHLMIVDPASKVDWFIDAGCDIIYIHAESERYVTRTLTRIRDAGCKAGLAINPDTSVEAANEMIGYADYILAMTVNPGFGGQKYLSAVTVKLERLAELKTRYGFKLLIDGAATPERIAILSKKGVDGFVLGTGVLFGDNGSYAEVMKGLKV